MAPLYTRETPSARNSIRRTIVQLQRPSPQPTLTWNRPEPLLSRHFSDTAPHLCPFFASLSLHSAARQSAGTGSAQILRSISPKSCLGAQLAISVNNCPPPRDPRSRMTSFKRTQRKYVQKAYRVRNWRRGGPRNSDRLLRWIPTSEWRDRNHAETEKIPR